MKRIISIIMTLSAFALLLASCGKEPMPWNRNSKAIRLTVSGVDTKSTVLTTSGLETQGVFNITAFATDKWEQDVIGHSGEKAAGLFSDPTGGNLKDKAVNYYSTGNASSFTKWVIDGNGDGSGISDTPAFSWINAVAMNFFAYAPVSIKGNRVLKWENVASPYTSLPFTYVIKPNSRPALSTDCDDIIFAYASNTASFGSNKDNSSTFGKLLSGSKDNFELKFYHALSQIRFCLSTDDDTFDSSLKLVSVKILGPQSSAAGVTPVTYAGLPSAGSCKFAAPASSSVDPTFTWTPSTTATDKAFYYQEFNADFSSSTPTNWEAGTYSPSTGVTKNLYTCTGDVFFLIPQTISGCNIEVTFQQGTDPVFSMVGKLPDGEWVAGKYYTYKIKASKGLDISLLTSDWYDASSPVNF